MSRYNVSEPNEYPDYDKIAEKIVTIIEMTLSLQSGMCVLDFNLKHPLEYFSGTISFAETRWDREPRRFTNRHIISHSIDTKQICAKLDVFEFSWKDQKTYTYNIATLDAMKAIYTTTFKRFKQHSETVFKTLDQEYNDLKTAIATLPMPSQPESFEQLKCKFRAQHEVFVHRFNVDASTTASGEKKIRDKSLSHYYRTTQVNYEYKTEPMDIEAIDPSMKYEFGQQLIDSLKFIKATTKSFMLKESCDTLIGIAEKILPESNVLYRYRVELDTRSKFVENAPITFAKVYADCKQYKDNIVVPVELDKGKRSYEIMMAYIKYAEENKLNYSSKSDLLMVCGYHKQQSLLAEALSREEEWIDTEEHKMPLDMRVFNVLSTQPYGKLVFRRPSTVSPDYIAPPGGLPDQHVVPSYDPPSYGAEGATDVAFHPPQEQGDGNGCAPCCVVM